MYKKYTVFVKSQKATEDYISEYQHLDACGTGLDTSP